jgi:DNA-binding XRE family transcriptional regulator
MAKKHPLKAYRERRGLTLREAAAQISTTAPTLYRIEVGDNYPSSNLMIRIAKWSGNNVTPNDLLKIRNWVRKT